jgi:hypothetical protein
MHRIPTLSIALISAASLPFSVQGADRRQNYDELAALSDKILLGSVALRSSFWGDDARIYTDVVLSPEVGIKGSDEGAVVVRVLGGTVGDTKMTVSDGPELDEGERVIVFLRREADHFAVTGRAAGTIRSSSPEAALALEGALADVEGTANGRLGSKRGLVDAYLKRNAAGIGGQQQTTSAAQVGCYNVDGAKWGTSSATYKIGGSIPAAWAPSIQASAATWSNAGAAFRLVNDTASSNELSYADLVAKYGSSYTNTLAVTTTWSSTSTGRISRATIEFNTKWAWSPSAATSGPDVQNIATHEFGHWMRLLDIYSPSTCGEVTMWGSAGFGETKKRTLEQADIDGFKSLYGAGGGSGGSGGGPVSAPTIVSPVNGASGVATSPALTWNAVTNATSYDVYFGNSYPMGLVGTVTGTSYQTSGLTPGTTYFWRVVAKNTSSNASSATAYFTVTTAPGNPTSGPTLISPANGATGVPTTMTMQWSSVAGATVYDVYIGTTPSPGYAGSIGATSARVSGFGPRTLYYWKVVARTPSGSFSSPVVSFRTN